MIAVLRDGILAGDMTSEDQERVLALKRLIDQSLTACFDFPDGVDKQEYDWHPANSDSPKSGIPEDFPADVRRELFTESVDFRMGKDNKPVCPDTRRKFYQFQLANQVHFCTPTCFKYKVAGRAKVCRFKYPVVRPRASASTSTIEKSLDYKRRKHYKILPPRNNAWVNPLPKRPLVVFASQGNVDAQYISNAVGAVEYATSYIGKAEQPDFKETLSLFVKKLTYLLSKNEGKISNRSQMRAAGTAIIGSQRVGAVQCCYSLLKLPFVILSRQVVTVNPLPEGQLNKVLASNVEILEGKDPDESAVLAGPRSQTGRRAAYAALCKQQIAEHNECNISFFQLMSLYNLEPYVHKKHSKVPSPGHISVDACGKQSIQNIKKICFVVTFFFIFIILKVS